MLFLLGFLLILAIVAPGAAKAILGLLFGLVLLGTAFFIV